MGSYITWLRFSRCKKRISDEMATSIIFNRGNNQKMMQSVCQGLDDLVYVCSHNILNKCFNLDTIHQINNGLLNNMKPTIDNLKVKIQNLFLNTSFHSKHLTTDFFFISSFFISGENRIWCQFLSNLWKLNFSNWSNECIFSFQWGR